MKIESSTMQLASNRQASVRTEVRESIKAWVGERPRDDNTERAGKSVVALSAAALAAADTVAPSVPSVEKAKAVESADDLAKHVPVLFFLKLIIEAMTGEKVKTVSTDDLPDGLPEGKTLAAAPAQATANFGMEYERHEIREESETTNFRAQGVIRTMDGKEIKLDIALGMSRVYREESSEIVRAGNAVRKDPLVINFDGTAAQLQSTRFSFDLDGDGKKEQVPMLAGNRGYLALDLNNNGKVDSGKELFGPASGNGFADLAQYDSDNNGWIDDNDPVFAQLKVWIQDGKGTGTLETLKSRGVGALYLGNAETDFSLKDRANQDLGQVRRSSVYLMENGSAGTLQQVDLMV